MSSDQEYNKELSTSHRALNGVGAFLQAQLTGDLKEVPGVGEACLVEFEKHGITTSFQLIGLLLSYKDKDATSADVIQRFWIKVNSILDRPSFHNNLKAVIVRAVAMKANTMFPGIYEE